MSDTEIVRRLFNAGLSYEYIADALALSLMFVVYAINDIEKD